MLHSESSTQSPLLHSPTNFKCAHTLPAYPTVRGDRHQKIGTRRLCAFTHWPRYCSPRTHLFRLVRKCSILFISFNSSSPGRRAARCNSDLEFRLRFSKPRWFPSDAWKTSKTSASIHSQSKHPQRQQPPASSQFATSSSSSSKQFQLL